MAKARKPNDDQVVKKIQKQYENLFSNQNEPPAHISVRQAEAMKARISELEAQLVEQSVATERRVSSIVQEDASPLLPAKSSKDVKQPMMNKQPNRPSEANSSQARSAFLIAMLIAIAHFVAMPYYLYLYQTSGVRQFYTLTVICFALGVLFLCGAILSKRGRPTQGIILVLGILAISYPLLTILVSGLGTVIGLALIFVGPMSSFQVLSRRSGWVMTVVTMVSGLITILLDAFGSTARPLLPSIAIQLLAASVVVILGFSIVRQFRNYSLSTKLIGVVAFTFILLAAVQFQISNIRQHQQLEVEAEERLSGYYQSYVSHVVAESNAVGALAESIADRPDVQELYLKGDREGLYALLHPMFEELKERQIAHLYIENPDGTVFLRVHDPKNFGDDITYRSTAADALALKEITSGIDMGPNRMGIRGVAPMYSGNQFIGMIEVGLDFDEQFLTELNELTGADFTIWITYESASIPKLKPAEGIPDSPIKELFYYAGTSPQTLSIDPGLYRSTLTTGKPNFQIVDENTSTPSIAYITPLLGYKGKSFGLLQVSTSYAETLKTLQSSRITSLSVVAGLAFIGLLLILITTSQFVLKPIESLAQFARLQMSGETGARVHVPTGDEFQHLANAFNSLANSVEDERKTMEQRVQERTHDLELAAEVGRTITEKVDNLYVMLSEATQMIRSRFNLYYTQVYLLDPSERTLILRAGTGDVGKQLLQRGHYLPVLSSSLNGRAASEKKPVIVADTDKSETFLPNPLLPNTRSEMVVPLIVGGRVLGVLDMQSEIPDALNQSNLPAFEVLAGQISVAIQNATLFTQLEEAHKDVEANVRQVTETGWQRYLNGIERKEKIGYTFNQTEVTPLENRNMVQAANALSAPIKVTGATVGAIQVVAEREWTSDETEVVQATAVQLAQHIENLRLLAQADSYRAEAEQAARRLTREGWDSFLENRSQAESAYIYDLNEVRPSSGIGNHQSEKILKQFLVVQDETIGELTVDEAGNSDEAAEILAAVAGQLSSHVENLRLFEQTQSALATTQASETALTEVMIVANMSNWELDINAMKFTFSDRFYNMVGTTVEEMGGYEVSVSDYLQEFVHPEDVNIVSTAIQEALQYPDAENFRGHIEYRLIHKDGQLRHVATDYRLTIDDDKKPIGGFGSFLDITERKKSEEIVRLAQQRAQTILDSVTVPMVITRLSDNHLTFVNRPAIEVTQFKYEDVIDRPSPDFYYNLDDRKKFISELRAKGNVADMVVQLRRQNGEPFWALLSARLFDYQNEASIVSTFMDITDRIRAQEAVAKRAAELQTVAEVSTTTATTLEPDRLLQAVVDITKERFDLYHAHVYLVDEKWSTLILAAGAGEVGRRLVAEEHFISMDTDKSLVARAVRERQAIIVNDVRSEPDFLSNPSLPETRAEMAVPMIVGDQVLGVFDVQSANLNGFSKEDASIYTTLASQIAIALQNARLYVEQSATVAQLRELDRLKSSFLANMSHELRTPLNSILGFADVILEELDGPLTDYMNNDLRLIQKNGQHLLHLINDVLDMAKIEAGRMNLNPEKFRIYEVLDEVTSITSTLASEKNLSLFIDEGSDQEAEIYADHTRLRQVMINLVNNAIKFTETGKIAVKVTSIEGARVLISVTDTGIGISADKLEAVFQEFTQVDTSSTRKAGGTGLGLPISRRLVEMHGGRLWAESTGVNGEGSTFFVELPIEARITDVIEKQAK